MAIAAAAIALYPELELIVPVLEGMDSGVMLVGIGEAEGEFVPGVSDARHADLDPRLAAGHVPLPRALRGAVVGDQLGAVHERIEVVDGPGDRLQADLDSHELDHSPIFLAADSHTWPRPSFVSQARSAS